MSQSSSGIPVFKIDPFWPEPLPGKLIFDDRGTAFGVAFSPDRDQIFLYPPNGASDKIEILDRKTLQTVGSFGRGGEFAGEWHLLQTPAVDSSGNIYTAESRGNCIQKFRLMGFSTGGEPPSGS